MAEEIKEHSQEEAKQDAKEADQKSVNSGSSGNAKGPEEVLDGVDFANGSAAKENQDGGADEAKSSQDPRDEEIEKLKKEVVSMKDAWSRERAEFMNYKKRVAQDQAKYRTDIISDFAKNLFPVMDNLERVMQVQNPDETLKNFLSGVEMIQKDFISVMEKESIRQLNPVNKEFDPYKMEAIAIENKSDIEKDMVVEVYQFGYVFEKDENDVKVLRPARVKVAKKS